MGGGPVAIDLGPAQSRRYRERGIARHTLEFTRAVVSRHPDLVGDVLVDAHRLPIGGIEDLVADGRGMPLDDWRGRPGGVLHLISPFELDMPLRRQWPREASAVGLGWPRAAVRPRRRQ